MADDQNDRLDRRLRDAFEPDARASARVAAHALAEQTLPRRRGWLRAAAVVCPAAAGLGLAVALVLWRGPETTVPPAGTEVLAGTLSEGLVVVPLPDGSTSITGGPAREGRTPEGYGFVLAEGELR